MCRAYGSDFFLQKLQNYNNTAIDQKHFDWFFHFGVQEYTDIIGTADPDLTAFQNAVRQVDLLSRNGKPRPFPGRRVTDQN